MGLGAALSSWFFRTNRWIQGHPLGVMGIGGFCVVVAYAMDCQEQRRLRSSGASGLKYLYENGTPELSPEENALRRTWDPNERIQGTLKLTPEALDQRALVWNVRSNEYNWSILAQDHQLQRDHFWYRTERSRDDDWGRHYK